MKILATVYAINPYKGSEDGTGWNLVYQIARNNSVTAITRKNNQEHIEKYIANNPDPVYKNMSFLYYDLPKWARWWKKGGRGALLYFYLWRMFIPFFIKSQKVKYDVVHALNFHNDWTPSFLWTLRKPFVWGPIGHHPVIPNGFVEPLYGKKAKFKNQLNWFAKICFWNIDPFLKMTKWSANHVIAINSSVAETLNLKAEKVTVLPAVATETPSDFWSEDSDEFSILTIGRFEPIKGMDVAIRAFADFYHSKTAEQKEKIKYRIIGKGPFKQDISNLINNLDLGDSVKIIEWMPRSELHEIYTNSKVFLFSSHEGAGMVVPEALSYGIPVVCFDNCGPGELVTDKCALKVQYKTYEESCSSFSKALERMYQDPEFLLKLSIEAKLHYGEQLIWNKKGTVLKEIYNNLENESKAKGSVYTPAKRFQWKSVGSFRSN